MDGEYTTKNEIKKVMSSSFEHRGDSYARAGWISSLRSITDGCGKMERTHCCDKKEETEVTHQLGPN